MTIDTYTESRLNVWANWRARKADGGQGYPKKSAFVQAEASGGFWTPDMDSQCVAIDGFVCDLLPERKEVLLAYYTQLGTNDAKAKQIGVSPRTFYTRLEAAKHDIGHRLLG